MSTGTLDTLTLMARLSQLVIPGLAQAFGVTMLALTAAVIGHFCLSVVHAREASILLELDGISVKWLAGIPKQQSGFLPPVFLQAVQNLAEVGSRLNAAAERVTEAASSLSAAGNQVTSAAGELRGSVSIPYHVTIERGQRRA